MYPSDFEDELRFRRIWNAVRVARPVHYSLFTFGHSDLDYYLVCEGENEGDLVSVRKGSVKVDRPVILTPDNMHPEFHNFFEDSEFGSVVDFILARTMAFGNLRLTNSTQQSKLVSDSVEEIVAKLNRQLDDEEEEHVAILTAPAELAGVAIMKYATERIVSSAPDNVQELRERGFLG
ncbi:MAG: hypothetical protein ISQ06_00920 [Planctomycetaceae bacterium]|jgi:hypothetical protein|nr:hypothetical protein [Planctomycetaceae bacterium]